MCSHKHIPLFLPISSLPTFQLQTLFTISSNRFSSFAHATYSLSVSSRYLVLDETYHPLRLQSQTARLAAWKRYTRDKKEREYHPLCFAFPSKLLLVRRSRSSMITTPKGFSSRNLGASLAVTRPILVSFFSFP